MTLRAISRKPRRAVVDRYGIIVIRAVTGKACSRRARKVQINMAALARSRAVLSYEKIAGLCVIEFHRRGHGRPIVRGVAISALAR